MAEAGLLRPATQRMRPATQLLRPATQREVPPRVVEGSSLGCRFAPATLWSLTFLRENQRRDEDPGLALWESLYRGPLKGFPSGNPYIEGILTGFP